MVNRTTTATDRERDENVANCHRRRVFSKHAECRASVVDVSDAEDARNYRVGLPEGKLLRDEVFGNAVDEHNEPGDTEREDALVLWLCGDCW